MEFGVDLTIGPSLEEGFYYDCFMGDKVRQAACMAACMAVCMAAGGLHGGSHGGGSHGGLHGAGCWTTTRMRAKHTPHTTHHHKQHA
jgi:hypothetical protein